MEKHKKRSSYGAIETRQSGSVPENSLHFNNYDVISIDSMNESIVYKINEQVIDDEKCGRPFRAKIKLPNLEWVGRSRRKSESDMASSEIVTDEDFLEELRRPLLEKNLNDKSKIKKLTKHQKSILCSMVIIDFCASASVSVMAPFFPNEAKKKGVSPACSGFVFSIFALTIFIASPFLGAINHKISSKALLLSGVALTGTCNILFGFLQYIDDRYIFYSSCLIVRIFEGVGAAAYSTGGFTIVAEIFQDQIGTVLGWLEICVGCGLTCGPFFGALFYDIGGFGLPFYSVGFIQLIFIPWYMVVLPSNSDSVISSGSVLNLLTIKPIVILSIVTCVCSIIWAFPDPTLSFHLAQFNLPTTHVGLFYLLFAATYAFTSPLWGYVADRMMSRSWILMVIGLLVSTGALLILGPSGITGLNNTIPLNILALSILGVSTSMALLPTFEAMLNSAIENGYEDGVSTYALIGGLWSSVYYLGDAIGPTVGAIISHHLGFPICTTVMAGITAFTAIVVLVYFQCIHRSKNSTGQEMTTVSKTNNILK